MEAIAYSICAVLGLVLIGSAIFDFLQTRRITAFAVYRFFFAIAYFLTPAFEFYVPAVRGIQVVSSPHYSATEPWTALTLATCGLIASTLAYLFARRRSETHVTAVTPFSGPSMWWFAYGCAIVCAIAIWAYSSQYGGVLPSIRNAGIIRAGGGRLLLQQEGKLLFFKYLIPVGTFAVLGLLSLQLEYGRPTKWLALSLSSLMSMLGLVLMAGRGRIIAFVLSLAVFYFAVKGRSANIGVRKLILLSAGASLGFAFIVYGKILFASLAKEDPIGTFRSRIQYSNSGLPTVVRNYENHFVSIEVALGYLASGAHPRYLRDVVNLPAAVLPSRLFGIEKPEPISVLNTYLISGRYDSETPPGLIAFGLYSAGPIGVVVALSLFGALLALIDNNLERPGLRRVLAAGVVVSTVVSGGTGDPRILMYTLLPLIFAGGIGIVTKQLWQPQ